MINLSKEIARKTLRKIRIRSENRMFWWRGPPYNFGDWIGPYLFHAITGRDPEFAKPSNRSLQTTFLTVGSLAHRFRDDSLIWGSGIIRANQSFFQPTETFAVRGPLTRRRFQQLGRPCPPVYGDPAILLPLFLQPVRHPNFRLGVIPHYRNLEDAQKCFGEMPDVTIIDVREELETVVSKICSCQRIVSSSLRGLIISHS